MIEENKSSQPEVKASKSDKRLRSYSHLKIAPISHQFWVYMDVFDICNKRRRRLLVAVQPPTLNIFDIPAISDRHSELDRLLREKETSINKIRDAARERETKLQETVRDLSKQVDDLQVALRQEKWAVEDGEKEKDAIIERLDNQKKQPKRKT